MNKLFCLISLFLTTVVYADIEIPQSVYEQIISEVIAESGYFDAVEIEERKRLWELSQPQPVVSAEQTASGSCSGSCVQSGGNADFPGARNVKFKGKINQGDFTQNLIVKWKRPVALPDDTVYQLKNYKIILSKDGSTFEKYKVKAKFKNNGKPKNKQRIKLRNIPIGEYKVQVRASYKLVDDGTSSKSGELNKSANMNMSMNMNSEWSNPSQGKVTKFDGTVGTLPSDSALRACLLGDPANTPNESVSASTPVVNISNIQCKEKGLTDADMTFLAEFDGLLVLNIKKNYGLTDISVLGDLPHLSYLNISHNKLVDLTPLANDDKFDSLESLFLQWMGLDTIPDYPGSLTFLNIVGNNISDNSGGYFPEDPLDVLDIGNNRTFHVGDPADGIDDGPLSVNDQLLINLANNNASIKTFKARHTVITDLSLFAGIDGIENLEIKNAELAEVQSFANVSGFCSLSVQSDDLRVIQKKRPVQFLDLSNSPNLKTTTALRPNVSEGGVHHNYRPLTIDLTSNNALNCVTYYEVIDNQEPALNDMSIVPPFNLQNGDKASILNCPTLRSPASITHADFCKPNKVENSVAVFEDQLSAKRFVTWEKGANHDHARWGVTYYKISTYLGPQLLNVHFQPSDEGYLFTDTSIQPDKYGIQACTENTCGYERIFEGAIEQGLTTVSDITQVWTTDNQQVSFKFSYSNDVFTDANGKGAPDYFKIAPTFSQPSTAASIPHVGVQIINNQHQFESTWQSVNINVDQYIGTGYSIQACRNDLGCGVAKTVNLDSPQTPNQIEIDALTGVQANLTSEAIVLTWDVNSVGQEVDYIKVEETQPQMQEGYKANINSIPVSGVVYKQVRYYTDELNQPLKVKRVINGDYTFALSACHRDRENEDVCSTPSNASELIDKTGADNYPNRIWRSRGGLMNNQQGYWSGYDAGQSSSELYWFKFQYSSDPIRTRSPDYFYFENLSGAGSRCVQKYQNTTDDSPTHLFQELNSFTLGIESKVQNEFVTRAKCAFPRPPGDWAVSACFSGIGCGEATVINLNELTSNTLNAYDSEPTEEVTIETVDPNNSGFSPTGGPGGIAPGSYWNPQQSGTGWQFHWATHIDGHPLDNNIDFRVAYDLVAYWFAYTRNTPPSTAYWTPTWYKIKLIRDLDTGFYDGSMLSYKKHADGSFSSSVVGTVKINLQEVSPENHTAVMHIDFDDAALTSYLSNSDFVTPCGASNQEGHCQLTLENINIKLVDGGAPGSQYTERFGYGNDSDHFSGVWAHSEDLENWNEEDWFEEEWSTDPAIITTINRGLEVTWVATFDDINVDGTGGDPFWAVSQSCGETCERSSDDYFSNYLDVDEEPAGNNINSIANGFNPLGFTPGGFWPEDNSFVTQSVGKLGRCFDDQNFNKGKFFLNVDVNSEDFEGRNVSKLFGIDESDNEGLNCSSTSGLEPLTKIAGNHFIGFEINAENHELGNICDPGKPGGLGTCVISFDWYTNGPFNELTPYYRKNGGTFQHFIDGGLCSEQADSTPGGQVVKSFICSIDNTSQSIDTYEFQLRKQRYQPSQSSGTYSSYNWIPMAQSDTLYIRPCSANCENHIDLTPPSVVEDPEVSNTENIEPLMVHYPGDGPIPGAGGVSGGAATYNLPIAVPPGINGMTPDLSINYSSKSGQGTMGVGWSVSAGSAIYRCPKTLAQDNGLSHAVNHTFEDRLCLDGQRLQQVSHVESNDNAVNDANYWAATTEYRTELDSFTKVVATGDINSRYFIAYSKSGQISRYDRKGLSWQLSHVRDVHGNVIEYRYFLGGANEYVLNEIVYTGRYNDSGSITSGSRKVAFVYNPVGDQQTINDKNYNQTYSAGNPVVSSKMLTGLKTYVSNDVIREYMFDYKASAATDKALLTSVTEKAGTAPERTLLTTQWSGTDYVNNIDTGTEADTLWNNKVPNYHYDDLSYTAETPANALLSKASISSDYNGDGIKEYLIQPADVGATIDARMLFLDSQGKLQGSLNLGNNYGSFGRLINTAQPGDLNQDGYTDYLFRDVNNKIHVATWKKGQRAPATLSGSFTDYFDINPTEIAFGVINHNGIMPNNSSNRVFLADITQDGKADLILLRQPFSPVDNDGDPNEKAKLVYFENTSDIDENGDYIIGFDHQQEHVLLDNLLPFGDWEIEPDVNGDEIDVYHWDHIAGFKDWNGDGYMDFRVQRKFYTNAVVGQEYISVVSSDRIIFIKDINNGEIESEGISLQRLGLSGFNGCRKTGMSTADSCFVNQSADVQSYNELKLLNYMFMDVNSDGLDDFVYYNHAIMTINPDNTRTLDEDLIRNWKVRLNQGSDVFSGLNSLPLFSSQSIESPLSGTNDSASDDDKVLLPQGDICKNIINDRENTEASESEIKMCHPIFRARIQMNDTNVEGRPELIYPNPDKLYFNHCALYEITTRSGENNLFETQTEGFDLLDNSDQTLMMPFSLQDEFYDSTEYRSCVAGDCTDLDEQRTTVGPQPPQAAGSGSVCSEEIDLLRPSMYLYPYTLTSAINDKGIYGFDAVHFSLSEGGGGAKLEVEARDLNLFMPINAPALGDTNGDGLLDSLSQWGCVDNLGGCEGSSPDQGSVVNPSVLPANTTFNFDGDLKEKPGLTVRTQLTSATPDLLTQVDKPSSLKTYQWKHQSISQLYDENTVPQLPYYALPERQDSNSDGYLDEAGAFGEYFYFNSSLYVVASMQQTTGLMGNQTIWDKNLYGYEEAVYNNQGRGFQGFRKITVLNQPDTLSAKNTTESVSTFRQVFPMAGKLESVDVYKNVSNALVRNSHTGYTWDESHESSHAANGVFFIPVRAVEQISYQDDGLTPQSKQLQESFCGLVSYDEYGNNLCNRSTSWSYADFDPLISGGELTTTTTATTTSEYHAAEISGTSWWVDKLKSTTVTTSLSESGAYFTAHKPLGYSVSGLETTQQNLFFWQTGENRLLDCQFTIGGSAQNISGCGADLTGPDRLKNTFTYDEFGHVETVSSVGEGFMGSGAAEIAANSRDITTSYANSSGYFANSVNNEGLNTTVNYDSATGQVDEQTSPDGITTQNTYDAYGFATEQEVLINPINLKVQESATTSLQNCFYGQPAIDRCAAESAMVDLILINMNAAISNNAAEPFINNYNGQFFSSGGVKLPYLIYKTQTRQPGSPVVTNWYDQNNQLVLTKTQHTFTSDSTQDTYVLSLTNHLGQTEITSQPFQSTDWSSGGYPYFNLNVYDEKGRMREKHTNVGQLTTVSGACWRKTIYQHRGLNTQIDATYSGAGCDATAINNLDMSRSYDASGKLRQTVDAKGEITDYWYDSAGNPYMVRDAGDNIIQTDFDDLGRKKWVDDPNMGLKTFQYNAFGEVVFSQDAKQSAAGVASYFKYDQLGRMVEQYANTASDFAPVDGQISYQDTFDYLPGHTYLNASYRSSNESSGGSFSTTHAISYGYDEFARVTSQNYILNSDYAGAENIEFNIDFKYYENNNPSNELDYNYLKQTIYTAPNRGVVGYSVVNEYDAFGSLVRQRQNPESDNPTNLEGELMRISEFNHRGQPKARVLYNNPNMVSEYGYYPGTGQLRQIINNDDDTTTSQQFDYAYDAWGNIRSQTLTNAVNPGGLIETLQYDELQRLISSSVASSPITYGYDKLGNLEKKSDYADEQFYGAGTAGPNAISESRINGGPIKTYQYDGVGNRITDQLNGEPANHYQYDANNLLTHSEKLTTNENVWFRYGVDNQRYMREEDSTDQDGNPTIEATFYAGSSFELIRNDATDETEIKFHATDYLTVTRKNNQLLKRHFLQKDRLGSTTQILDENGAVIHTKGYDAFGKPRDGDTWARMEPAEPPALNFEEPNASSLTTDITKRGFTGHEHLDNFELIHMNGRMYDFNNGRFLSVDPFIQGVTSQAINPYSYILNNPLAGTDPTGYRMLGQTGANLGLTTAVAIGAISEENAAIVEASDPGTYGGATDTGTAIKVAITTGSAAAVVKVISVVKSKRRNKVATNNANENNQQDSSSTNKGATSDLGSQAERAVDDARASGKGYGKQGAAGALEVSDETAKTTGKKTYTGGSKDNNTHPAVQKTFDKSNPVENTRSAAHAKCAEASCMSQAVRDVEKSTGTKITTPEQVNSIVKGSKVDIRNTSNKNLKEAKPACEGSCQQTLKDNDIDDVNGN